VTLTFTPAQERGDLGGPLIHGVVRRVARRAPTEQISFGQLSGMAAIRPPEQVNEAVPVVRSGFRIRVAGDELVKQGS